MKRKSPEDDEESSNVQKKIKTVNTQDPLSNKDIFDNLIAPFLWSFEINAFQRTCKKFNERHHNGSAAWTVFDIRDLLFFKTVREEFNFKSAKRIDIKMDSKAGLELPASELSELSVIAAWRCTSPRLQCLNLHANKFWARMLFADWRFYAPRFGLFNVASPTVEPNHSMPVREFACRYKEVCEQWDVLRDSKTIDTLIIDETFVEHCGTTCVRKSHNKQHLLYCMADKLKLPGIKHVVVQLDYFAGWDESEYSPLRINAITERLPNLETVRYTGLTFRRLCLLQPTYDKLVAQKVLVNINDLWIFHYQDRDFVPVKRYLKEP